MSTSSSSEHPAPTDGTVLLEQVGSVAVLTLSNPKALNAMTWHMYETLGRHLDSLAVDETVRVLVLRGDGDRAFAAGTDIKQFTEFDGDDGIDYEIRLDRITRKLTDFPKPTIAAVHGYAVGGGFVLSAACDLRYATAKAKFGAPIAKTLGNCLSLNNYRRLASLFGESRLKELIFTARILRAEEAQAVGFVTELFDETDFFDKVLEVASEMTERAPLTLWATKVALARIQEASPLPNFDDVVRRVYSSEDFHEGVSAHIAKRKPNWQGR